MGVQGADGEVEIASSENAFIFVEIIDVFGIFAIGFNEFVMGPIEFVIGGIGTIGAFGVLIDGNLVLVGTVEDSL